MTAQTISLAPLILAHRGASFDAPENTLAAFKLAREMRADGVELDTSLSRDGIPVVIHDLNLNKTTNGSGPVQALDLKTLKALDASYKHKDKYAGEPIPTLDEVFETLGPSMFINVELKSINWRSNGLEPAVLNIIRRHRAEKRVIVSSFNPMALRRFRALAPDIPIGYLYSPEEPIFLRQRWFMFGVKIDALHPHHSIIDQRYMEQAKRNGLRVNTWTVDEPERIAQLKALGVDAIITNRPDVALKALGR